MGFVSESIHMFSYDTNVALRLQPGTLPKEYAAVVLYDKAMQKNIGKNRKTTGVLAVMAV